MQFSVLLGMLLTILSTRKTTRAELAGKYEVDKRTVSRYLDVIASAGVPIETVSGRYGGIRLPDNFRLDNSFFSKEELGRLSTCVRATQSSFADNLNLMLLDKINHMAKNKEDEKYLLKSDSLIIDIGTWTNPQQFRNKVEIINKAIAHDLSLNLEYTDRNSMRSDRLFDPYSLVLKEGVWYLYGWCHMRRDFRLFKLSRIRSLNITTHQFVRVPSDVYAKLSEGFDDNQLVEVELEFYSTIYPDIEEWLGTDAISDHGSMYRARVTLFGGSMLIGKLLSFGSSLKVLSPPALKEELAVECKRITQNYLL